MDEKKHLVRDTLRWVKDYIKTAEVTDINSLDSWLEQMIINDPQDPNQAIADLKEGLY